MFVFSACSKGSNLNFDENGTVQFTYTCIDEEQNFDAELNAERSRNLILSLNKITYVEVTDVVVDLAPSYDFLRMTIGNDNLCLSDVWYRFHNGGYFFLNGKLCQSEEKFDFLESYLVEYCPNIIPNSVSFGVQYVKSTIGAGENYRIIKSIGELNDYIATEVQNIDLPDIVLFKDEVISKYDDEYFENFFIVIFMRAARSGSYGFKVNDVYIRSDRLIIDYEIVQPSDPDVDVTCDMAYWYSFVELSNEYNTINNVDINSLK